MRKQMINKILAAGLAVTMTFGLPFPGETVYAQEETVNQDAGVEVKTATVPVCFGAEQAYTVTAEVAVSEGKIVSVDFSHTAAASGHENSVSYAEKAKAEAQLFSGLDVSDENALKGVDTISGATITSEAYKNAVIQALGYENCEKFSFGSSETVLEPGVYQVPVSLRNASKHDVLSVASDAFKDVGTLTIKEDGSAILTAEMDEVKKAGMTDMAHSIKIYQEDNILSETKDADVLEEIVNPEGVFRPDHEKDKIVPSRISFSIPDNSWDGVYVNLFVDVMNNNPDAWLFIDYTHAAEPGASEIVEGAAKVDQFGKYTIHTKVSVTDGVISNVDVYADHFISETHRPTNEMKISQVTNALKNTWNGIAPTQENAEKIYKKIMKEDDPDQVIDAVSGATYSAKAVRDAVMDAFDLDYQEEVIHVPESVEAGIYEVEIGYYSDIVWHSLVENVKSKAVLTVNQDKTMMLEFDTFSGTEKEPLYILGFNGIYPENDRTGKPVLDGCSYIMGLSSNDYEDQFFEKGTQVVNHVKFPLNGGMNKIYNTNCSLYVPAMNKLNGKLSGVEFENGHFNADVFAKIYWDSMKKISDLPEDQWMNENGRWWYQYSNGTYAKDGWKEIRGLWYYFDQNGWMQTGWLSADGFWYYLNESGAMAAGWKQLGGSWYYFNDNGAMATGWKQLGGSWYYFNDNGAMVTGWKQLGGSWYYFNDNGVMDTGWKQLGEIWYYFNENGAMVTGWEQIDGIWYYFDENGVMASDQWIGNFYVNASGAWV